ncbi:MAG: polysaccharide deacetylase family protein [Planctomycetaceae bacterium]
MRARLGTLYSRLACRFVKHATARVPASERGDGQKVLYLTFDDGPTDRTPEILAELAVHDLPAIHFLVGDQVRAHPRRVREILAAGHEIGNHTQSHVDAWKAPLRRVIRELTDCSRLLERTTGAPPRWVRPPFGRLTRPLVRWSKRHGQRLLLWDLMPPDFESAGDLAEVRRVGDVFLKGVRPGGIVVFHDNAKAGAVTARVLRECLPRLIDAGWRFERVPNDEPQLHSRHDRGANLKRSA